jgi:hypothetical protein
MIGWVALGYVLVQQKQQEHAVETGFESARS